MYGYHQAQLLPTKPNSCPTYVQFKRTYPLHWRSVTAGLRSLSSAYYHIRTYPLHWRSVTAGLRSLSSAYYHIRTYPLHWRSVTAVLRSLSSAYYHIRTYPLHWRSIYLRRCFLLQHIMLHQVNYLVATIRC